MFRLNYVTSANAYRIQLKHAINSVGSSLLSCLNKSLDWKPDFLIRVDAELNIGFLRNIKMATYWMQLKAMKIFLFKHEHVCGYKQLSRK